MPHSPRLPFSPITPTAPRHQPNLAGPVKQPQWHPQTVPGSGGQSSTQYNHIPASPYQQSPSHWPASQLTYGRPHGIPQGVATPQQHPQSGQHQYLTTQPVLTATGTGSTSVHATPQHTAAQQSAGEHQTGKHLPGQAVSQRKRPRTRQSGPSPKTRAQRRRTLRSSTSPAKASYTSSETETESAEKKRARPRRAVRRPVSYAENRSDQNLDNGDSSGEDWQRTVSEAEEDARIERSMGVIRKNAASRGNDGGTKYHCDVCSVDITATVRISCAESSCPEYDLCVQCFANAESSKNHDPKSHRYHVIEQNSIPIFDKDWGADEELLLLEGAERYGLGSWADISEHIGGYRSKEEVRDHYINTYVNSSKFPLPELADPQDTRLFEEIPKDEFQARKKRRIEERKEAAKSAPPAAPKQKPTASVPSCHEVQGFMPGRLEFETEFANDAEEAVQHMQFEPGDGIDPATGNMDEETTLKMTVFDIYNSRLQARTERKRIIFEHNLLDYKKNTAVDKKRTKEERELHNKAKPFAKMMNHEDFEGFTKDVALEQNLRTAIQQLQEWKTMGVTDLKSGEKYEAEKANRAQRSQPQGSFDRLASTQKRNQFQSDSVTEVSRLTGPELPHRFQKRPTGGPVFAEEKPEEENDFDKMFAETTSGALSPPAQKPRIKYVVQPLTGTTPWKLEEESPPAPDLQLLSEGEKQLCNALHMRPKPYLTIKEALVREAMKQGGNLKKKDARSICRIDVNKANRIFDFMIHSGWIAKG